MSCNTPVSTHHCACDCREEWFAAMRDALEEIATMEFCDCARTKPRTDWCAVAIAREALAKEIK